LHVFGLSKGQEDIVGKTIRKLITER